MEEYFVKDQNRGEAYVERVQMLQSTYDWVN